ncbi:KRAB-A domain-containing protein 2-like isoform X2 [Diabrotica undecimpunctata]|uniref:KRAB-A domain-containing protein 2-like isoform X2 n=1 Tax=Diabrotica undecimpunctata TaxID=50387 RepID=UPI003B63A6E7
MEVKVEKEEFVGYGQGSQYTPLINFPEVKHNPEDYSGIEVKVEIKEELDENDQESQLSTSVDLPDMENGPEENYSGFALKENRMEIMAALTEQSCNKEKNVNRYDDEETLKLSITSKHSFHKKDLNKHRQTMSDLGLFSCFKERFNEMLCELVSRKDSNTSCMNSTQYSEFLKSVKVAKNAKSKSTLQYRRLKRFDVCVIGGVERLIAPVAEGETNIRHFARIEDVFDILHEIHLAIGHSGKHRMMKEVNKKYKNITQEVVMIYLKLCMTCQKRQKFAKRGIVVQPMVCSELNSRCQVDLIDMQSSPDRGYKFIMVYQDCLTKFVQIRPLQSDEAEEVAKHLLDIFCIFGAPTILQSDNGREFANRIIGELRLKWSGLKILHGQPRHSQSQGSVERVNQDIQNMLKAWMIDEETTNWSDGLRFVQVMKNRTYHAGIKRSPYKAMFGSEIKVGLQSSSLPKEVMEGIETEEDLEKIINEFHHEEETIAENENVPILISENVPDNIYSHCSERSSFANGICKSCSKEKQIFSTRHEAESHLENQAETIKEMSAAEFPVCNTVLQKIPDVDRGRDEFRNALMSVVEAN